MVFVQVILLKRMKTSCLYGKSLRGIYPFPASTQNLSLNISVKQFFRIFTQNHVYPLRVLFFGTDDFALQSLKRLNFELKLGNIINSVDVISSSKCKHSSVKKYCDSNGLKMFKWPIEQSLQGYDIGLVASFGHLIPEGIIHSFPLGMLNVHASLLPRWRGAAPVIYAIMNGDKETGVSIMRIMPKRFDVGDILAQSRVVIGPHDNASILTHKLAVSGAELLIHCLKNLPASLEDAKPQSDVGITYAPKVMPSLAVIKWSETNRESLYNLWRALYGTYQLTSSWHGVQVKLMDACCCDGTSTSALSQPGRLEFIKSNKILLVTCADGAKIGFRKISIAGKKTMSAEDFYNGYMSKRNALEWYFK